MKIHIKQDYKFIVLCFILFTTNILYANVFNTARQVSVLKTEYFDIIFSKRSAGTAYLIASNGTELYKKAAESFQKKEIFRMPVVISPDSDSFSIEYTQTPYNRIIIYEAVPEASINLSEDFILSAFYKELLCAMASTVRSPFWEAAAKITSNAYIQPTALLNIPHTFLNGAVEANSRELPENILNDKFAMQTIVQAKSEKVFPKWNEVCGGRDIYPNEISIAAASAFCAYLHQTFGLEKFIEYWNECGKVHFFKITAGIFYKVYGIKIEKVWQAFEDSIPIYQEDSDKTIIFDNDSGSFYTHIVTGKYGLIFYDSNKGHVYKLTKNDKKKILTSASKVTFLSVSPTGNYLAVSYKTHKTHTNLDSDNVRIFNIEKNDPFGKAYKMRNGTFVLMNDRTTALAGFVQNRHNLTLKIFSLPEKNKKIEQLISINLPDGLIPTGLYSISPGNFIMPFYKNGKCSLIDLSVEGSRQLGYKITDFTDNVKKTAIQIPVSAKNFTLSPVLLDGKFVNSLVFSYAPQEFGKPAAMGFIPFSKDDSLLSKIYLYEKTFSGGMHNPIIKDGSIYFSSHNAKSTHLCKTKFDLDLFYKADISNLKELETLSANTNTPQLVKYKKNNTEVKKGIYLENYKLKRYNSIPYILKGSWIPFFPIANFDYNDYDLSLGLGLSYITNTDPLEQKQGIFSFSKGFLDPENNYGKLNNNFNFSAMFLTSQLPADIYAGTNFNFSSNGSYSVSMTIGSNLNFLTYQPHSTFTAKAALKWNCTTEHTNPDGKHTKLDNWPGFEDAFHDLTLLFGLKYTAIRQYGRSKFEKLGIETEYTFATIFDFTDIYDYYGEKEIKNPSQLKLMGKLGFNLPYLIPVFAIDDWILCIPFSVYSQWNVKQHTAIDAYAEFLLAGYEVQKSIPKINIYMQRAGFFLGYNADFRYDIYTVPSPDIREINTFVRAVKESIFDDYLYLKLLFDFSPVIGKFSKTLKVTAGIKFNYHLRNRKNNAEVVIKVNM